MDASFNFYLDFHYKNQQIKSLCASVGVCVYVNTHIHI